MSLDSSSSGSSQLPLEVLHYLLTSVSIAFLVFHAYRTAVVLRQGLRRDFLVFFHVLSSIAFFSVTLFEGSSILCNAGVLPFLCNSIFLAFWENCSIFSLNALFALLGYYCRKELVFARHGRRRWESGHRWMTVLTAVMIVSGLVNFLYYDLSADENSTTLEIIGWCSATVGLGTVIGTSLQVFALSRKLNFSQRVLPFLSTRYLFAAVLLNLGGNILQLLLVTPRLWSFGKGTAYQVVTYAQFVFFLPCWFLLAWLFRQLPHSTSDSLALLDDPVIS